ncbi:MAG: hypothetical protein NVSMB16_14390 [Acidimicrobiales bacterium]
MVAAAMLLLVMGVSGWAAGSWFGGAPPRSSQCMASAGSVTFSLDREQARNATTIAAVAKRMGLANHAVTVGLAAGLQESKLRNLTYGDRDSVGLFQQRPSQGWGTRRQILVPSYAARAFFSRLVQLPGWETLPVTEAAQAVQRSGAPAAYAQWDQPSRVLAQALTGEVAAGFTCRLPVASGGLRQGALTNAEHVELGVPGTGVRVTPARGWTVAGWLIGHAADYGVTTVDFSGHRWSARTGAWAPLSRAVPDPEVVAVHGA